MSTRQPPTVVPVTPTVAEARLVPHEYERSFQVWRLFVGGERIKPTDRPFDVARKINDAVEKLILEGR